MLDPRLADLWSALWGEAHDGVTIELAGALLRLAYLTGYQDALTEPERGSLFTALGLPVPARVTLRPAARRASR